MDCCSADDAMYPDLPTDSPGPQSINFQQLLLIKWVVHTLRPQKNGSQYGPHFPNDIFKRIFMNENIWILIKFSLKFVPKGPINNIPALVQIMAWRRPSSKPLSEPMMVSLLTHICVTQPQWVKQLPAKSLHTLLKVNQLTHKYKCTSALVTSSLIH